MDTSETYIKMRLAAIPDLGLGAPILSAMFVVTEDVSVDNKGDFYIHCDRAPYWCQLERQDQLQAMVGELCTDIEEAWPDRTWNMLSKFMGFCGSLVNWGDASMEQLWLAFVMKENHGKYRNGETWIKGDNNDR